jgi:hypothetical protein
MTIEKSMQVENLMLSPRALTVAGIGGTWVVAECMSRHEKSLTADLLDAGFDFFLPLVRTTKTSGRKRFTTFAPLNCLSGYVFASSSLPVEPDYHVPRDLHDFLDAHRSVFGMIEVRPSAQAKLVEELAQLHGAILNTPDFADRFTLKGVTCRVTRGPYVGCEGVVIGEDEGYALLPVTLVGQLVPTRIDVADLSPI